MEKQKDKMWFSHHAKSSAAVVSVGIHALLLVLALSFVAVTVITKDDKKFEAKQITRPKMPIKRLQVPVNVKKKAPKPKLRKRIVVKPNINKSMPDIKMPEVSGLKGGLGAAGGLGGSAGIGFSMPEISVFGVKSKGEKVFIALNANWKMVDDKRGGLPGYVLIKDEVTRIIAGLSSTTLFNLSVFEGERTVLLFPKMVPATSKNIARVKAWLDPLNEVSGDVNGIASLGEEGVNITGTFSKKPFAPLTWGDAAGVNTRDWHTPIEQAMKQQADTVFLLTGTWWGMGYAKKLIPWDKDKRARLYEYTAKAKEMLDEENLKRIERGEPRRVLEGNFELTREYFPNVWEKLGPPTQETFTYTPNDVRDTFLIIRKEASPKVSTKGGLKKKKKTEFSVNVIYFALDNPSDAEKYNEDQTMGMFKDLTTLCHGQFRSIAGLEAIESARFKSE